ncbi:hypothetical protein AYO43_09760 [Nitrospira sp. SCGC AG-212-E16]|nr:hypothetical protein AYO43_09760 [Nitrospira sp. SCGC AG-212-E16]
MPTALISYRVLYSKTNRAKQLEGLFRAWNWLLSRATPRLAYAKHSECPFWYGERCQVGWLALAAHRVGWVPLQEPNVSRKGKGAGRGDLSAIKGYRKNAKYYDFEAKFANLDLSTLKPKKKFHHVDGIGKKLQSAVNQTRSKKVDYQGDVGVGLVFILLYTRKGTTKSDQLDLLDNFKTSCTTKEALIRAKADFVALYLASHSSVNKVFEKNDEEYEPCLGVAVLGKIA